MNFKTKIKDFFTYSPPKSYNFSILEHEEKTEEPSNTNSNSPKKIFSNINDNLNYIKVAYNTLINSDIEIRDSGNNGYGYNRLTFHPTGGSGNYVELYSSNSIDINGINRINITTRNFNINGSAGETTDYLWIKNSDGDSRYLKFENGILVDHSWPW